MYFYHETLCVPQKTRFLEPSRKGPGSRFGGPLVHSRRAGRKFGYFFQLRAQVGPARQKLGKTGFGVTKTTPGTPPEPNLGAPKLIPGSVLVNTLEATRRDDRFAADAALA